MRSVTKSDLRLLAYRDSLSYFTRMAFRTVDPGAEYLHNWHIDLISEYLEACRRREIKRLIINMPPRMMKSISATVAFPAYLLGHDPSCKIIATSYSQKLSFTHSMDTRRVIESDWYKEIFSNTVLAKDQNEKSKFATTAQGMRMAASVGSTITGLGGDYLICFPYDEVVATEYGDIPIGKIVEERMDIKVYSFNTKTRQVELKPIQKFITNPGDDIIKVTLSDGSTVRCTPDHKIWTDNRGWVQACQLVDGDMLPNFTLPNSKYSVFCDIISIAKNSRALTRFKNFYNLVRKKFTSFCRHVPSGITFFKEGFGKLGPIITSSNGIYNAIANSKFRTNLSAGLHGFSNINSLMPINNGIGSSFISSKGSMFFAVIHVLGSSAIFKIYQMIVARVPVQVSNVVLMGSRAYKGKHDSSMNVHRGAFSVFRKCAPKISFSILPSLHKASRKIVPHFTIPGHSVLTSYLSRIRNAVLPLKARYRKPVSGVVVGHVDKTYCLTVADNHTLICGSGKKIIASNCDDPHDPGQALSDVQRETAINWFDQTLSTRLNNRKNGVIIVVMQRLHQGDLSGHLLEMGGWEHLCLRGIEDENRIVSFGGFKKTLKPGDLLHEDRVGHKEIEELKKQLKHGFAGQILQRPTPMGGGVIELDWFGRYNIAPTEHKRVTQSWDTAFKANAGSDYSVCTTWLETDKGHYLVDVFRKQMEYPDLKRSFVAMRDKWQPNIILVEDKASGQSLLQDFANDGQFNTVPIKVDKDKVTRAGTASDLIEAGNVYLPNRADWLIDLETEIESFPNGIHDDMVDSMSQYLNWVRLKGMIQPRVRML